MYNIMLQVMLQVIMIRVDQGCEN